MTKPASISLILKTANDLEPYALKLEYIREVAKTPTQKRLLLDIVAGALHPNVEWLLPKGNMVYHPVAANADADFRLFREQKNLYMFCKGGLDNFPQPRREMKFIQLLESIHPDDAKLLIAVKDKILPYPNLTYDFWSEAFPGLLPVREGGPWEKSKPSNPIVPQIALTPQEPINVVKVEQVPVKVSKPNHNKGKGRWNDGIKNIFATDDEAKAKGLIYGWLSKQ